MKYNEYNSYIALLLGNVLKKRDTTMMSDTPSVLLGHFVWEPETRGMLTNEGDG